MATIVKWSPMRELDAMERRMRRLFGDFGFAQPALLPAADMYETDDEFIVELEVPGFAEKELEIELRDHMVRVKGERAETKERKEKAYHLHERLENAFERRFELPAEADTERITATFEKGVLEIHAPKAKEAAARTVAIAPKKA